MSLPRKPRILMVAPSCGTYGGIEVFTTQIAKEVLEEGSFDVRVVFRLRPGFERQMSLDQGLAETGVPWRLMRRPDRQYLADLLWADAINCHFPLTYATFPARALGKKLLITVENRRIPQEHTRAHEIGLRLGHERWYISDFVRRTWEGDTADPRSFVVPAVSDLPYTTVATHQRSGFFFIARWIPLKGIEQLLEAYATADLDRDTHRLALYGDGPLRPQIEELISRLGITAFVDRPGFVSHAEKTAAMASAKWNVAPAAFEEDLGLTPIEARSCGVPSIVTKIGGLPEAAGERALLCKPGDVASLRQCLKEASRMPEEEYAKLSSWCGDSLRNYLPRPGFYSESFTRILKE